MTPSLAHGPQAAEARLTKLRQLKRPAGPHPGRPGQGSALEAAQPPQSPAQAIAEGEQILTVPLRLSFTDVASKAEGAAAKLPWPVRLAARILGEYYEPTSPWKQYLHVRALLLPCCLTPQGTPPSQAQTREAAASQHRSAAQPPDTASASSAFHLKSSPSRARPNARCIGGLGTVRICAAIWQIAAGCLCSAARPSG